MTSAGPDPAHSTRPARPAHHEPAARPPVRPRSRRSAAPRPLRAIARVVLRTLRHPLAVFSGPIFQIDNRIAGRRLRTYVARAAYLALLLAVVSLALISALSDAGYSASAVARTQAVQGVAIQIAGVVFAFQFGALIFLAPTMTGGAIVEERLRRTLPALLTTPLTPLEIAGGKLASRLLQLIVLMLLSVPVLLAVRVFGGLPAEAILSVSAVTLCSAIAAAAIGVYASCQARRASTGALGGLLITVGLLGVPPVILQLVNVWLAEDYPALLVRAFLGPSAPASPPQIPPWVFLLVSPPLQILHGIMSAAVGSSPFGGGRWLWVWTCLGCLAVAAFFLAAASLTLRRVMRREAEGVRAVARAGKKPKPEERSAERAVSDHPVLWRELRRPVLGSRRTVVLAWLAVAGMLALSLWRGGLWEVGIQAGGFGLAMVALLASVALRSAEAASGEREAQTWDVLLTTPLPPREIVFGKLAGAVRRQGFPLLVLAVLLAVSAALKATHWAALVILPPLVIAPVVMLSGTGVLLSMLVKRTAVASAANLGLAIVFWLFIPLLVGQLYVLFRNAGAPDLHEQFLDTVLLFNPVVIGSVIQAELCDAMGHHAGGSLASVFTPYPPLESVTVRGPSSGVWSFGGVFVRVLVVAAIQAGIGLAAAGVAVAAFRRLTGRSS